MEFGDDRHQISTSSSSSSYDIARENPKTPSSKTDQPTITISSSHKKKSGRKKFKETRHPIYRGVRQKNGSKWVCEVREPNNKKLRIWVGTFHAPEMAARAYDVAALALRGETAALNFADSAWLVPRAQSSSAVDIQRAAFQAAMAFQPSNENPKNCSSSSSSSSLSAADSLNVNVNNEINVQEKGGDIHHNNGTSTFLDEEVIFNVPGFLDSMAEGMLLTPPAMERGFRWDRDVEDDDIYLNLWME